MRSIHRHFNERAAFKYIRSLQNNLLPPISMVVPAYNESVTIVESIHSYLSLEYPTHEVIVVDDGSTDNMLDILKQTFKLQKVNFDAVTDPRLRFGKVMAVYKSLYHDNLMVVEKVNGGKADALNAGIHFSRYEHISSVDADSLLEPDALFKVAIPFVQDPEKIVAVGGTVLVANSSKISHGRLNEIGLSKSWLVRAQVIEYMRSFLCARTGWNELNATVIISGAFGLFSKRTLLEVNGYRHVIGEDMDLIVRLHRYARTKKIKYKILFIPDPVCWTEAPESLHVLKRQRERWQIGLIDVILDHRNLLFNPKYGYVGLLAFPYLVFAEFLGPFLELLAFAIFLLAIIFSQVDQAVVLVYFFTSVMFTVLLSIISLYVDEVYYGRYRKWKDYEKLLIASLFEGLIFRNLVLFFRVFGSIRALRSQKKWVKVKRIGWNSGG